MINFFDKAIAENWIQQPWLVLGKGPSLDQLPNFDISYYKTFSLNHVIENIKVDVAHIIDFDVAVACQHAILKNAKFLVMPLYPHINFSAQNTSLLQLCDAHPFLQQLDTEGRLLWYNSSTSAQQDENYPSIPVKYFSADAAVALLAYSGIKLILSLGIDGGKNYATTFQYLNDISLLANGRESFDIQFDAISETVVKTGATFMPLPKFNRTAKIYVGSQKEQMLAVKVLEYSIKKHASIPVTVFPMHEAHIDIPVPKDKKNQQRTPFSFQRFLIPALNYYISKAIYLDSDMLVFSDIAELWSYDMGNAEIFSTWKLEGSHKNPQYSVMLMNCEKLDWNINDIVAALDNGQFTYEQLLGEMVLAKSVQPAITPLWNSLEHYVPEETKLLHYTDMNLQPWINRKNTLTSVWVNSMKESIAAGFISENFLKNEILSGHARPSLWLQYKVQNFSTPVMPFFASLLDIFFVPPHQKSAVNSFKNRLHQRCHALMLHMIFYCFSTQREEC